MRKKIIILCITAALIFAEGIIIFYSRPVHVSVIALINNPNKYNGRLVRVEGVGNIEFEGTQLYWSKGIYNDCNNEDRYHIDAIWLDLDPYADESELNGKYVVVEGRYNKNNKGHMDCSCGALENITLYEALK